MIFISAGHHNADPGAVANGLQENNLTKEVRNLIIENLDKKNIILDKDFETNTQYQRRIKPGTGSVVFDIHFNAGLGSASGTECYVNSADAKNKGSLSYIMADEISKATSIILGIPNRGVRADNQSQHSRIGILNLGSGISVLWEVAFITSAKDIQQFSQKKEALCKEIASILKKYDALK